MKNALLVLAITIPSLTFGQITGYDYQNIHGYDVYVQSTALNNHPQETNTAISLLTSKLAEINDFGLKTEITDSLQAVKIFMDWNTTTGAAVYHPNLNWLIANGYIAEKWKSVEISNITNFVNWTAQNQPYMVMHELAHAYHDRVLGFGYQPILQSYNHAMQNALYDLVSYHIGNGNYVDQQAYATTNEIEYFAELTEAYLGENDFFPFNDEDLEVHDTMGYSLVFGIWQFENISGTDQESREDLVLYPNPTSNRLTIQWKSTGRPDFIQIISTDGKTHRTYDTNLIGDQTIDISTLSSGMYYLILDAKQQYKIIKLE